MTFWEITAITLVVLGLVASIGFTLGVPFSGKTSSTGPGRGSFVHTQTETVAGKKSETVSEPAVTLDDLVPGPFPRPVPPASKIAEGDPSLIPAESMMRMMFERIPSILIGTNDSDAMTLRCVYSKRTDPEQLYFREGSNKEVVVFLTKGGKVQAGRYDRWEPFDDWTPEQITRYFKVGPSQS